MTTKRWMEGRTKRYHTWPIIGEQTVADHSWGVAQIILELWPDCSKELLVASLDHDRAEKYMGDMPSTTKWKFPELSDALSKVETKVNEEQGIGHAEESLSHDDFYRLRAADLLELLAFSSYQYRLGNLYANAVITRGADALTDILIGMTPDDQRKVLDYKSRFLNGEDFK